METAIPESLSPEQRADLLAALRARFERNMRRHPGLSWDVVLARLEASPAAPRALYAMDLTGGEPDVTAFDAATGGVTFTDCAKETPTGRRNTTYDRPAQDEREKKGVHPAGNAVDMAAAMGIELLDEAQYRALQTLGEFDTATSSWVLTPPAIRRLGGALFMDRRYNTVFVYHNSAPSFYGVRGFRGMLRV